MVLINTQSAVQYRLSYSHSNRGNSGFSFLPKDTLACRWGRLGSNCQPSDWRMTALHLSQAKPYYYSNNNSKKNKRKSHYEVVSVIIVAVAINKWMYICKKWKKNVWFIMKLSRTLAEDVVLQWGPGHTAAHKRMWPHASQTTSDCGLSDKISNVSSMHLGCVHYFT